MIQNTLMAVGNKLLAQSDEMGALPTMYAATMDIPGGSYVGPDSFQEQRGHPTLVGRSGRASDRGRRGAAVGAVGGDDRGELPAGGRGGVGQ